MKKLLALLLSTVMLLSLAPDGSVDYVKGANIAGFMKVAQAMLEQGII